MATKEIVKVQVPLFSSVEDEGILVYNEDRSIEAILPIRSERELKQLRKEMKGEPKAYFYADTRNKMLILTGKAPWQEW